jgi:hypothetical protein
MAEFFYVVGVVLALVLAVPVSVYISVKLGTFAFYRGRELYLETKSQETKNDETQT